MTAEQDLPGATPEEDQQLDVEGDDEESIGTPDNPGISAGYTYSVAGNAPLWYYNLARGAATFRQQ